MSQVTPADNPLQSEKELLKSLYKNAKRVTKNTAIEDIKAYAEVSEYVSQEKDTSKKEKKIQEIVERYDDLCKCFESLSRIIEEYCDNTKKLVDSMTFKDVIEEVDQELEVEKKKSLNRYNNDLSNFLKELESIESFDFSEVFLNAYAEVSKDSRQNPFEKPRDFFDWFSVKTNKLLSLTQSSIPEKVFDDFFNSMSELLRSALEHSENASRNTNEVYHDLSSRFVQIYEVVVNRAAESKSLPLSPAAAYQTDTRLDVFDNFLGVFNELVNELRNDLQSSGKPGTLVPDLTSRLDKYAHIKLESYRKLVLLAYEFADSDEAMDLLNELSSEIKMRSLNSEKLVNAAAAYLVSAPNKTLISAKFVDNAENEQIYGLKNFVEEYCNGIAIFSGSIVLFAALLAGFNIDSLKNECDAYKSGQPSISKIIQKEINSQVIEVLCKKYNLSLDAFLDALQKQGITTDQDVDNFNNNGTNAGILNNALTEFSEKQTTNDARKNSIHK